MDILSLGYRILMIFSVVDSKYVEAKGKIILDFIRKYFNDEFDMNGENSNLIERNGTENGAVYKYLRVFNLMATQEQKAELMIYAYNVMVADERIHPSEKRLFRQMGDIFGINPQPVLADVAII